MTTINKNKIDMFTDGACSGNPGKGGCCAILKYNSHEKIITGYLPLTTNNQMEMLAAIIGLRALKFKCTINLYTDSVYLKNGMTNWLFNWKKNFWKTSSNKIIKNLELWKELDSLASEHIINWHWIKGHNGHIMNEKADLYARKAITNKQPLLDQYLFMSNTLNQ